MSLETQLVVVGAGPGGYVAAFKAADLGMRVTLVDAAVNPGGVCLYRGCIPSKALLHVAKVLNESKAAANWGISFSAPTIDIDKLRSWKDEVIGKMTGGLGQLVKTRKIDYIQGHGTFLGNNELRIKSDGDGGKDLRFEHAILATGSVPATIPTFDIGSDRILDSTSALELSEVPETMLVVGGGYIGLELGSAYAALGTRVSVVEMTDGLIPPADRDLIKPLARRLDREFEQIMLKTKVLAVRDKHNFLQVELQGADSTFNGDYHKVLVAVGRQPNSARIGLDQTSVQLDQKGFVQVDAQRRTAAPSIFAIGDIAGEPMLAHKAFYEASVAVEAIAGHDVAYEPNAIPAVVFTDPEIAWCGLTEKEAAEQQRDVEVARFPWAASGRATTLGSNDGLTKLVVDPKTERVLGMGIVGSGAGELIAEGVLAVEMAALASDVKLSIHPHPTLAETVMEAAEVFFGESAHLYAPKRK